MIENLHEPSASRWLERPLHKEPDLTRMVVII